MLLVIRPFRILQRLPPRPRGLPWSPQRYEQMDNGRQQHHTARLVRRRERDRDQIQERGDPEQDLEVGHRERRRGHALREGRQDRAQRRVERRRVQCRSCAIRRDRLEEVGKGSAAVSPCTARARDSPFGIDAPDIYG